MRVSIYMLHASETRPLTKTNLQRLQRNDRAMIRQICSIKPEDVARVRSSELLAKLQLEDLDLILRERRLRWFWHVERSSGAIRTAYDMQIDGKRGAGRPKQTWFCDDPKKYPQNLHTPKKILMYESISVSPPLPPPPNCPIRSVSMRFG